ncbi:MAG TPA: hypothetical protein VGD00_08530 [Solirubrobacteraceae bacterium]
MASLGAPTLALAANGLTFVVVGTVAFSLLMSVLFLVTRGKDSLYDQIGQGGLSKESDYSGAGGSGSAGLAGNAHASAEQEQEIRQMLRARSDRMVGRGEPALDVEAELQRLLAASRGSGERDPALIAEVRQLVQARNERRLRQGLAPLDVEDEVARTLDELDP